MGSPSSLRASQSLVVALLVLCACPQRPRPELERVGASGLADANEFPDAPAVILLDRTEVSYHVVPGKRVVAEQVHTRRLQILNERGLALARVRIPVDERATVVSLEGRVIKADGNEHRLAPEAVVDVGLFPKGSAEAGLYPKAGYKLTRFSDVQVGDIIEVVTLSRARDGRWLPPVSVGGELPLLRGEVVFNVPRDADIHLRVSRDGRIVDEKPTRIPTRIRLLTEPDAAEVEGTRHAFVFGRTTAVFPEGASADAAALATQVHAVLRPGGAADVFRSSDDVAAWYRELTRAADKPDDDTKQVARSLQGGSKTERVRAVQRYLQDQIKDTPEFFHLAAVPVHAPREILQARVGSGVDQACLGLALLRAVGIDGFAVLVSRAGSFAIVPDLPSPAPFNHVVLAVPMGGSYAWIDPATPALPTGRIGGALQGATGLIVRADGGELLELPEDSPSDNVIDVAVEIELQDDGSFTGMVKATLRGVDGAAARGILAHPADAPAAMQALLFGGNEGHPEPLDGFELADVLKVSGKGNDADDVYRVQARLASGRIAPASAVIMQELAGRPFSFLWRDGRRSAVFLDHRRIWKVRIEVKMPPGLGVSELPVSVDRPGPVVSVEERWAVADGALLYQRTLTMHERVLPASRYEDLRAPILASWQRSSQPVVLVAGGDRGAAYGGDPF